MKLLLEILLSIILHPIAMIFMWINLAARDDMSSGTKIIWFIVSIVWGLGPLPYLVADGTLVKIARQRTERHGSTRSVDPANERGSRPIRARRC